MRPAAPIVSVLAILGCDSSGRPNPLPGDPPGDCQVSFAAADSPVVVAASVACQDAISFASLALGAGDSAWAAFTPDGGDRPRVARIDPAGDSGVADGPNGPGFAHVLSDPAGDPHLVTDDDDERNGVVLYSLQDGKWAGEVAAGPCFENCQYQKGSAYLPDGRPAILYYSENDEFQPGASFTALTIRDAQGNWSRATVPGPEEVDGALTVDAGGGTHVVYWHDDVDGDGSMDLVAWQPGGAVRSIHAGPYAARPVAAWPLAAIEEADGLHLIDATSGDDAVGAAAPPPSACPDRLDVAECDGPAASCTRRDGDVTGPHALARTGDGAVWLAYTEHRHETDLVYAYPGTGPRACLPSIAADRDTTELVVARALPGAPARTVWSLAVDGPPALLRLEASGGRLALGWPAAGAFEVRILDAEVLP